MLAKCLNVRYEAGDYSLKNGVKGGASFGNYYKNGKLHQRRGFGWESVYIPSKLILLAEVNGKYTEIWIDHYFKTVVGCLTKNRIERIIEAMPDSVKVIDMGTYYSVEDSALDMWRKAANL